MSRSLQPDSKINLGRTAHKVIRGAFRDLMRVDEYAHDKELAGAFLVLFDALYQAEKRLVNEYFSSSQPTLPNIEPPQSEDGDGS